MKRWLREPDLALAMALLLGFVILCAVQVIVRFILTVPLSWTEELVSASVIWMTFLGAIAVERRGSHIRVELIEDLLPPRAVAAIYGLFDLTILVCLGALLLGGWETLSEIGYQRTPALGIPVNALIAVVPLASVPMAFFLIRRSIRRVKEAWT